jgi:hypothetical protein
VTKVVVFVRFSLAPLHGQRGRRANDSYQVPLGKVPSEQLVRITKFLMSIQQDVCTLQRQDIQIHYVSLDRTPQLWAELEKTMLPKRSLWKQFEILPLEQQELIQRNL